MVARLLCAIIVRFSGGETPPLRILLYIFVGEAFRLPFLCAIRVCFLREAERLPYTESYNSALCILHSSLPRLPKNNILSRRGGVSPPVSHTIIVRFSGCRGRHPLRRILKFGCRGDSRIARFYAREFVCFSGCPGGHPLQGIKTAYKI